jgi:hypothetical protein
LIIIMIVVAIDVESKLLQDGIVQPTVGGVSAGAQRPRIPVKISELSTRLGHDDRARRHVV